jgi:hypothetical protein
LHAAAAALMLVLATTATSLAADSPNGDRAGAWPTSWRLYTLDNGGLVRDVIGDVGCGSGYCDVSSGGSGTASSVYFASDGTNVFFRIRVKGDPRDASHGGFRSTAYVIQIAVNETAVAAVGLNGKPAHRDFVYVANASGTSYAQVYAYPFNSAGGELSAGARAAADGSGHYLVDWQVPLSRITAWSGGAVTGSTPVQLFFGTSQAANLAVINKDYMIGNSVDFGPGTTVTLVPPPATGQTGPGPSAAPQPTSVPPAGPSGGGSTPVTLPNTRVPSGGDSSALLVLGLVVAAVGLRRLRLATRATSIG